MKKKIALLGSTGSIGKSVLEIVQLHPHLFEIVALSCHSNIETIQEQRAKISSTCSICIVREDVGLKLQQQLKEKIFLGSKGLKEILKQKIDLVICAISGYEGIYSMLEAIRLKIPVAIANKEPLVVAGKIVSAEAKKNSIPIYPIDSEHNAIFQCLQKKKDPMLEKIILTASGGPFLYTKKENFIKITLQEALQHPKWNMGKKNTIDSATTMNKALEIIEAKWLFDLQLEQIEVLVHPQSIIHGIVQYKDGSSIAQLSLPDMKVAISYCLGQNFRILSNVATLNLIQQKKLEFLPLEEEKFPCVKIMKECFALGEGFCSAMNGINEVFVRFFLEEKISFSQMMQGFLHWIEKAKELALANHCPPFLKTIDNLEDALTANEWGMDFSKSMLNKGLPS